MSDAVKALERELARQGRDPAQYAREILDHAPERPEGPHALCCLHRYPTALGLPQDNAALLHCCHSDCKRVVLTDIPIEEKTHGYIGANARYEVMLKALCPECGAEVDWTSKLKLPGHAIGCRLREV